MSQKERAARQAARSQQVHSLVAQSLDTGTEGAQTLVGTQPSHNSTPTSGGSGVATQTPYISLNVFRSAQMTAYREMGLLPEQQRRKEALERCRTSPPPTNRVYRTRMRQVQQQIQRAIRTSHVWWSLTKDERRQIEAVLMSCNDAGEWCDRIEALSSYFRPAGRGRPNVTGHECWRTTMKRLRAIEAKSIWTLSQRRVPGSNFKTVYVIRFAERLVGRARLFLKKITHVLRKATQVGGANLRRSKYEGVEPASWIEQELDELTTAGDPPGVGYPEGSAEEEQRKRRIYWLKNGHYPEDGPHIPWDIGSSPYHDPGDAAYEESAAPPPWSAQAWLELAAAAAGG
jgi:hypothetical protein